MSPRKRSHPDDEHNESDPAELGCAANLRDEVMGTATCPQMHQSLESALPQFGSDSSRLTSPALSTSGFDIGDTSTPPVQAQQSTPTQPAKRRKLTFAEKESMKIEKELREKQKAEQKAKKEDEKRTKEEEKKRREEEAKEEKRKKEEEREEKRRIKELEKATKDDEKRRKEEEKAKKEKVNAPRIDMINLADMS